MLNDFYQVNSELVDEFFSVGVLRTMYIRLFQHSIRMSVRESDATKPQVDYFNQCLIDAQQVKSEFEDRVILAYAVTFADDGTAAPIWDDVVARNSGFADVWPHGLHPPGVEVKDTCDFFEDDQILFRIDDKVFLSWELESIHFRPFCCKPVVTVRTYVDPFAQIEGKYPKSPEILSEMTERIIDYSFMPTILETSLSMSQKRVMNLSMLRTSHFLKHCKSDDVDRIHIRTGVWVTDDHKQVVPHDVPVLGLNQTKIAGSMPQSDQNMFSIGHKLVLIPDQVIMGDYLVSKYNVKSFALENKVEFRYKPYPYNYYEHFLGQVVTSTSARYGFIAQHKQIENQRVVVSLNNKITKIADANNYFYPSLQFAKTAPTPKGKVAKKSVTPKRRLSKIDSESEEDEDEGKRDESSKKQKQFQNGLMLDGKMVKSTSKSSLVVQKDVFADLIKLISTVLDVVQVDPSITSQEDLCSQYDFLNTIIKEVATRTENAPEKYSYLGKYMSDQYSWKGNARNMATRCVVSPEEYPEWISSACEGVIIGFNKLLLNNETISLDFDHLKYIGPGSKEIDEIIRKQIQINYVTQGGDIFSVEAKGYCDKLTYESINQYRKRWFHHLEMINTNWNIESIQEQVFNHYSHQIS